MIYVVMLCESNKVYYQNFAIASCNAYIGAVKRLFLHPINITHPPLPY